MSSGSYSDDLEAGILNNIEKPRVPGAHYDPKRTNFFRNTEDTNSKKYDINILKSRGPSRAIVLRQENIGSGDDGFWSELGDEVKSYLGWGDAEEAPKFARMTCRIPEIHSACPVPSDHPDRSGAVINAFYHTFTSQTDAYQEENCPSPGEIVWCDYGDRENMASPQFIKPVNESKFSALEPDPNKKTDPKNKFKNPPGQPSRPGSGTRENIPRGTPVAPGSFKERIGKINPVHHPQPARELSYKQAYEELEWMKQKYGIEYSPPLTAKEGSKWQKPFFEGRTILNLRKGDNYWPIGVRFVYKGSRRGRAIRGPKGDKRSKQLQPSMAVAMVRMALWLKEKHGMDTIFHAGNFGSPGSDRHNEGRAMDITGFGSSKTGKTYFLLEDWGLAGTGPMTQCKNKKARLSDNPRRCPQHPKKNEPAGYRLDPNSEVGAFFLDAFKFMQSQFCEAHNPRIWPPQRKPAGKIGDHGYLLTPDHPSKCTAIGHADHFHVEVTGQDQFIYQRPTKVTKQPGGLDHPKTRHSMDRFKQRLQRGE